MIASLLTAPTTSLTIKLLPLDALSFILFALPIIASAERGLTNEVLRLFSDTLFHPLHDWTNANPNAGEGEGRGEHLESAGRLTPSLALSLAP